MGGSMTQWSAVESFETRNTRSGCTESVRGSGAGGGIREETEVLQVGQRQGNAYSYKRRIQLQSSEVVLLLITFIWLII